MGENLKHFNRRARGLGKAGAEPGRSALANFPIKTFGKAKVSLRIPPTTCISHEQNVKEQCSRENMLLQIVQNLTPNKANLTQVACKSQKKFPLNLFKLRQVRPENSIFYYNLTSKVSSLKY